MTLELRRVAENRLGRAGIIALGAIVTILAVTGGAFVIAGANPLDAYYAYFIAPLTREFTLLEVLNKATPILFTGAAVAIAFRAGYWNIGVEGQLLMGAVAAAGIGQLVEGWPPLLVLPLMIAAGALAGAAWALVPALLRVRLGIDEVVTTLLLNPVALLVVQALLHGPWKDPETGFPESPRIAEAAEFPPLSDFMPFMGKSRLHLGFVIAIVHHRRRLVRAQPHRHRPARARRGPALRTARASPASRWSGRCCASRSSAAPSPAIAGVSEVAGIQFRLTEGVSPGFGYTGIVVAMLGGLTMPGVLLAGLLLGDLSVGASSAVRSLQIPSQLGDVVQGTLLLVVIGARRHLPLAHQPRGRPTARRG